MKHFLIILCALALLLVAGCTTPPQYAIHYDDATLYITPTTAAAVGDMVQIRVNAAASASVYIHVDGMLLSPHDINETFTIYEFAMPRHEVNITHTEGEKHTMSSISIPATMTCHRISYTTPYVFDGPYAVITNTDEASALFAGFSLRYPEAVQPYPAGFFDNYAIIAFLRHEGSGSVTHSLESVKAEDGILTLTINREVPPVGTCDIASWLCLVTVSKSVVTQGYTIQIATQDKNVTSDNTIPVMSDAVNVQ